MKEAPDVAPVSERPVVFRPIGDPILFLVLGIAVSLVCFLHCGLQWIKESNGWNCLCSKAGRNVYAPTPSTLENE